MDASQGGSNAPPPFLTKTYDMVEDPASNGVVSWSPTNDSFVVWDVLDFSRDLLPKYFKHNNFSSFVRQLNTYGFRKIDPNQWEFANDEFVRGQRHLLKNIHRRKPIHSHSLNQQASSAPLTESERQELEEEIERLKYDKSMLLMELKKHTLGEHGMDQQMHALEERLHKLEQCQKQLIAFLGHIVHRHDFLSNFMQLSEIHGKKRRLPKPYYLGDDSGMDENSLVNFQPVGREKADTTSVLCLDMEPFEKMESSLSSLENFFRGVSHVSGETYDCHTTCGPFSVVLTQMHALSGDTDVNFPSESPELDPSLCLGDVHASPNLIDSTDYAESPVISSIELHAERSKVSEIDVNSEPAGPEEPSLCDQANGSASSALPTGVNDIFWEQFLTETPGSSSTRKFQSRNQDMDSTKVDVKTADMGNPWWTKKNIDRIMEQVGQLAPAERT